MAINFDTKIETVTKVEDAEVGIEVPYELEPQAEMKMKTASALDILMGYDSSRFIKGKMHEVVDGQHHYCRVGLLLSKAGYNFEDSTM